MHPIIVCVWSYFVPYGFISVCIFYLLFWETSLLFFFLCFCLFGVLNSTSIKAISLCKYKNSVLYRSSQRRCPAKESVFKKFTNLKVKQQCWSFAGLKACNFIKKRLQHRCFPVNLMKFLRTPILKNICRSSRPEMFFKKVFLK